MDRNAVFAHLAAGVPADVQRLYMAGYFDAANARIEKLLADDRLPEAGRGALLALRQIMHRIPASYTLGRDAAIALMQKEIPDFTPAEFDALVADDRIDWRYIEGRPY